MHAPWPDPQWYRIIPATYTLDTWGTYYYIIYAGVVQVYETGVKKNVTLPNGNLQGDYNFFAECRACIIIGI